MANMLHLCGEDDAMDDPFYTFTLYGRPVPASRPRVQQFDRTGKPLTDRQGKRRVLRYYAPTYDN